MTHKATKTVIITEKLILDGVIRIIEEAGAGGYTVTVAGGKGSRNVRPAGGTHVVDAFTNVKIEVITSSREMGDKIAEAVLERYFQNYSGITYIEDVEVLRPQKF